MQTAIWAVFIFVSLGVAVILVNLLETAGTSGVDEAAGRLESDALSTVFLAVLSLMAAIGVAV